MNTIHQAKRVTLDEINKKWLKTVTQLMDEVDEDIRCEDTKAAREKNVESQHILKASTGLCKPAIAIVRERVVANEMKLGALNRHIKKKKNGKDS